MSFSYGSRSRSARTAAAGLAALLAVFASRADAGVLITGLKGPAGFQSIVTFDSDTPGMTNSTLLSGVAAGDELIGIDFRPTNGQLYAVGRNATGANLYTISGGVATSLGAIAGFVNDAAASYGFDFNPMADLAGAASLRVISSAGANMAINVATLATLVQTAIGPAGVVITGSAYSNNDVDPNTPTTLYGIDAGSDTLLFAGPPNGAAGGQYIENDTAGGLLGVDASAVNGFDILGAGTAFAALQVGASPVSALYQINLATGAATLVGNTPELLTGLAIGPQAVAVPEPSTMALLALGGLGMVGSRFRRRKPVAADTAA